MKNKSVGFWGKLALGALTFAAIVLAIGMFLLIAPQIVKVINALTF